MGCGFGYQSGCTPRSITGGSGIEEASIQLAFLYKEERGVTVFSQLRRLGMEPTLSDLYARPEEFSSWHEYAGDHGVEGSKQLLLCEVFNPHIGALQPLWAVVVGKGKNRRLLHEAPMLDSENLPSPEPTETWLALRNQMQYARRLYDSAKAE